ncbi:MULTISPECIES: hypothetical protein [Marinobacter]|uniref:Uncharacterized protein n=1 Tax=Marinobacter nauticus (strain ATCC 700491 / DSM 11845 / VT8) TaxID=351348 RepID=A1U835_MARN8|nr:MULTISPECIES: hypothetical protein [Marinobacter]ABM21154.1 hypothetical protein Maqu_4303 [Marinobacter nauticus VT8]
MPTSNPAFHRLTEAWNRVHQALASQQGPAITTPTPALRQVFFVAGDNCLTVAHTTDQITELTDKAIDSASRLDAAANLSPDYQHQLASDMEAWLERPAFVPISAPVDLFQRIDDLPLAIQDMIDDLNTALEQDDPYTACREFQERMESQSYTFDYGLDGTPTNLRKTASTLTALAEHGPGEQTRTVDDGEDDDPGMAPR